MLDSPELSIVIGSKACQQLPLASIFLWNEFSDQNVNHLWFLCGSLLPQPDRSIAASIICRRLCLSTCHAWIENSNFAAEDAWSALCRLMSEKSLSVDGWTWVNCFWRTWSVSKMCCETTIENWSTWWNFQWSTELQNFHQNSSKGTLGSQESHVHLQNHATNVFSESAFGRKTLIPAARFPKRSFAYAECAFGLESKVALLNPVCQYRACGLPHGLGDCRKSGWGHHPSAMRNLFVLGSSRQILSWLKTPLPGRVLQWGIDFTCSRFVRSTYSIARQKAKTFGLESKVALLNPDCQYRALIACGLPHGLGNCRKSGWGHHPSAMSSLFVLGSSRQILSWLKTPLPGRVLQWGIDFTCSRFVRSTYSVARQKAKTFGLESIALLNPDCQYRALIACGLPHGLGNCRKSGWGHHPSAMSSLFVLGSSRQILSLLKHPSQAGCFSGV